MTLDITVAETQQDRKLADKIVVDYHSYVASSRTVGRCLKYLIHWENRVVGTFWIGSGFKPTPRAILDYFQVGQGEFDAMFNTVADNKRYCMSERIPNLGSQILRAIRKRAARDWRDRYGDDLRAIVTTIGGGHSGSVYLADNWKLIGETSGLPSNRHSVSMKWDNKQKISERFVKPTGENRKRILITERLG